MAASAAKPRPARRRWLAWALIVVAALVAVLTMRDDGSPTAPAPQAPGPSPADPGPAPGGRAVPSPISMRLPAGFQRTQDGAIDAAVAYVTLGQALLDMVPADADRAVRAMATSRTADAQVEDVRNRIAAVHRALAGGSGPLRYRHAAVATRLDQFTPEHARVSVWHVGVLSKAGIAPPQAGWAISVVDLLWESDDWRLETETISAGPAPLLDASAPPATAEQLDSALAGFSARTIP